MLFRFQSDYGCLAIAAHKHGYVSSSVCCCQQITEENTEQERKEKRAENVSLRNTRGYYYYYYLNFDSRSVLVHFQAGRNQHSSANGTVLL